jgi:hypothetical protein
VNTKAWRPGQVEKWLDGADIRVLRYIPVDNPGDDWVSIAVSPWPTLDNEGGVRFEPSRRVQVRRAAFETFLDAHRRVLGYGLKAQPPRRPLRSGDVFAAHVRDDGDEEIWEDPSDHVGTPVYDVSRHAREVAKTAYYSAVAPRWSQLHTEEYGLMKDRDAVLAAVTSQDCGDCSVWSGRSSQRWRLP